MFCSFILLILSVTSLLLFFFFFAPDLPFGWPVWSTARFGPYDASDTPFLQLFPLMTQHWGQSTTAVANRCPSSVVNHRPSPLADDCDAALRLTPPGFGSEAGSTALLECVRISCQPTSPIMSLMIGALFSQTMSLAISLATATCNTLCTGVTRAAPRVGGDVCKRDPHREIPAYECPRSGGSEWGVPEYRGREFGAPE